MLRVKLEIVPFGEEEDKYDIATIIIGNIGMTEDQGFGHQICNYSYKCTVPVDNEEEVRAEGTIYNHDRRDGAIELVNRVLTSIESL